jgi:hypothetical protein
MSCQPALLQQPAKPPIKYMYWLDYSSPRPSLLELSEQIGQMKAEIEKLIVQKKQIPYKIPLSKMPQDCRYNKLNQESKHLQNIIKKICYRAETASPSHFIWSSRIFHLILYLKITNYLL